MTFDADRREMNAVKADRLQTRADTIKRIRRALIDITEGADLDGWPAHAVEFASRARRDLGNVEAILHAAIADLRDPIESIHPYGCGCGNCPRLFADVVGDVAMDAAASITKADVLGLRGAAEVLRDEEPTRAARLLSLADRLADWLGGR